MQIFICVYRQNNPQKRRIIVGRSLQLIEHSLPVSNSPAADDDRLTWDDTYAIALALQRTYPDADLQQVSLGMIYTWTLALNEFADNPQLANEEILAAIYREWFEEIISK